MSELKNSRGCVQWSSKVGESARFRGPSLAVVRIGDVKNPRPVLWLACIGNEERADGVSVWSVWGGGGGEDRKDCLLAVHGRKFGRGRLVRGVCVCVCVSHGSYSAITCWTGMGI